MRALRATKSRLLALLLFLVLAASACADQAPQDFLNKQAGPRAVEADNLWDITFWIAVAVFVLVEGVLVFTVFRFRRRKGREAAQFHGNTKVEVMLTAIPALILAGLAVPTIQTIFDQDIKPEGALEITVVAKQFWWEYEYPDLGIVTANEMHIPVDTPIYLTILGANDDVIHSFWVPRLVGTQDAVPGRENTLLMEASEPGEYLGQCKEFCGLSHANMRLRVFAEEQGDFDQWAQEQAEDSGEPSDSLAQRGKEAFLSNACIGCHAIGGTEAAARVGPNLTHFASRKTFAGAMFEINEENLRRWVADAPSMKPGVRMPSGVKELGLTNEDVEAITAYLLTLE